jgi:hypothetical protein
VLGLDLQVLSAYGGYFGHCLIPVEMRVLCR